ncbi:MAG: hypothetical protein AAGA18_00610 [Verrucomicrobiota bacterium]
MAKRTKGYRTPAECPVCGAAIPPKSLACPECGADERSGWNEDQTSYDALDLPDDSFDYHEFLENEGLGPRTKPEGLPTIWKIVAGVCLVFFILLIFRGYL